MSKFIGLIKSNEFLILVKNNINWIKDIFWIGFTFVASIISFVTYKKSKNDVFVPLRIEVVKRQADLLLGLLSFLNSNNSSKESFYFKLDYVNIAKINFILNMKYAGITFKDKEVIERTYKEVHSALASEDSLVRINVIDKKDNSSELKNKTDIIKENKEKFQNENYKFPLLYLTAKYDQHKNILIDYIGNPLLPEKIKVKLELLLEDIFENIHVNMPKALNKSFKELINSDLYSRVGDNSLGTDKLNADGVFNNFNSIKVNHDDLINEIIYEMRCYLKVDNIWD